MKMHGKGIIKKRFWSLIMMLPTGLIIFSTDIMYHNVMVMTMVQQARGR